MHDVIYAHFALDCHLTEQQTPKFCNFALRKNIVNL